jgi:hypothetical protein
MPFRRAIGHRKREEREMQVKKLLRALLPAVAVATVVVATTTSASADPTGSKNAFSGTANCGAAGSFRFVVNNANGQGQGTDNGNQAQWAPAHLIPTNDVFHPTAFNLTFTFTPAQGPSQSFTDTSVRKNQSGDVTCLISGSQTDPQGNTFSLNGTVIGTIS